MMRKTLLSGHTNGSTEKHNMSYYQIEYSNKESGWVPKKQSATYNYYRMPNSPSFNTIEEAEQYIRENHKPKVSYDTPWIDHVIEKSHGHLMSLEDWKEDCENGAFIDYDGYGSLVDKNYKFLSEGGHAKPSQHTHKKRTFPEEAKYILWYNK